jgi:hypothetical protein
MPKRGAAKRLLRVCGCGGVGAVVRFGDDLGNERPRGVWNSGGAGAGRFRIGWEAGAAGRLAFFPIREFHRGSGGRRAWRSAPVGTARWLAGSRW